MVDNKTRVSITGTNYGRYIPVELLGKGAMGKVYLADDPFLQRHVALKIISVDEHLDDTTRNSYMERFHLEARASAKLKHPSVVAIYDAGQENGAPWIAFEYIEGESLEDKINKESQIPIQQAVSIIFDIASALEHAHDSNIVHRDIKPANILINKKTGVAKLSDFGVVKAPFSILTQEGQSVGSPGYMSPEQIEGASVDPRSDLFSLGIVFYQIITGKHPFLRDTLQSTFYATLMGEFKPVEDFVPDVNPDVVTLINRLLKVNPSDRVQSSGELITILKKCISKQHYRYHHSGYSGNNRIDSGISIKRVINATNLRKISAGIQFVGRTSIGLIKKYKLQDRFYRLFQLLYNYLVKIRIIPANAKKTRITKIANVGIIALIVILFFLIIQGLLTVNDFNKNEKQILKNLAVDGHTGNINELIKDCESLITSNNLKSAEGIADELVKIRKTAARAYLQLGRIELRDEDEDDAIDAFRNARQCKRFTRALSKEKKLLLKDVKNYFTENEASNRLIQTLVYTIKLGDSPEFKNWVYEKPYWLRWNSLKMLNETNQKIDMVEVYLLDLQHGGSLRTRIRAATKLGEMGDKRAIPFLQEIAQRGFADPIVSANAQAVLDQYFKNPKDTLQKTTK
jgi:tRNA A-37 threonylcarbamoyl transferase component Bud32